MEKHYFKSESSAKLNSCGYSHKERELYIEFRNGEAYCYKNVDYSIYKQLVFVDTEINNGVTGYSLGKTYNEIVKKPGYDYKKIS